jgi:hypothetical protein
MLQMSEQKMEIKKNAFKKSVHGLTILDHLPEFHLVANGVGDNTVV